MSGHFPGLFSDCIGEHFTEEVNGVSLYYEKAGAGAPVILLHGNGGSHKDLALLTRRLAEAGYTVYAVDSRGQGANEPLQEYHYVDMADDVYALIRKWKLDHPALYGWSDGGIVGLLTEIRHPGTLGALAVSGVNTSPDGLKESFLAPLQLAGAVHADPLMEMIRKEPMITTQELQSIQIPVLVTAGEHDIIKPEHIQMVADSLPFGQLHILQGESHGSYITGNEKMADLLLEFLKHGDGSFVSVKHGDGSFVS